MSVQVRSLPPPSANADSGCLATAAGPATMALRAKMAALAEQLDDKLDQKIDQAAAATSKLQAAAKARVQTAQGPPVAAAKPPAPAPPTPPARAAGGAAIDMVAAAKAFESVPKEELVGLLAKTNSRCRELEMRYAELNPNPNPNPNTLLTCRFSASA